VPEVLFVCVHNAGRPQVAAALLHHRAAGAVTVRSAGCATCWPNWLRPRTDWRSQSSSFIID
jgi:protein-tyrosine-phosphatase